MKYAVVYVHDSLFTFVHTGNDFKPLGEMIIKVVREKINDWEIDYIDEMKRQGIPSNWEERPSDVKVMSQLTDWYGCERVDEGDDICLLIEGISSGYKVEKN